MRAERQWTGGWRAVGGAQTYSDRRNAAVVRRELARFGRSGRTASGVGSSWRPARAYRSADCARAAVHERRLRRYNANPGRSGGSALRLITRRPPPIGGGGGGGHSSGGGGGGGGHSSGGGGGGGGGHSSVAAGAIADRERFSTRLSLLPSGPVDEQLSSGPFFMLPARKRHFHRRPSRRRGRMLRGPARAGTRTEIMSSTSILPERKSFSAGSKRPQRDPTSVISFTMSGAVSSGKTRGRWTS